MLPDPGSTAAYAETVVFADGGFMPGKLVRQNRRFVYLETRFGLRIYAKKDVVEIVEDEASDAVPESTPFEQLPPAWRAILNAEADYRLGHYKRAMERIQPFLEHPPDPGAKRRLDWLLIRLLERQGKWAQVVRLLKEKQTHGRPEERVRAKAHLDILEANPDRNLRYVGEKHARLFITDAALLEETRQKGSLQDERVMRKALEEYCEQLLVENRFSIKAFADKLDVDTTYKACLAFPRAGDVGKYLPYMEDLKRAEITLVKAQAILGDYGSAFELDLVRTEINHLQDVLLRFVRELEKVDPDKLQPAFDARTGLLTPQGRAEWQQRCDETLKLAQPFHRLLEYMNERITRYPDAFQDYKEFLHAVLKDVEEAIKAVKRARNRTRI
ncbi:MAG: hypothetical protein D6788_04270 [Planctomycetota bacterium]|nr:MAG: hypothetical protein D6788_04270 [Planctomycetota bacterium]